VNHSFGRRVVMPLPTPCTLLNTYNVATVASRVSRVQSIATTKVPTTSFPNTTPKQQEIFILNKDLIFTNPQASTIDYRLALMYVCLKTGYISCSLVIYRRLTTKYPDQEKRFADANIYNAIIEVHMKRGEKSICWALDWFDEMKSRQIKPNLTTYVILIKRCL
jgi:hypothetical protein